VRAHPHYFLPGAVPNRIRQAELADGPSDFAHRALRIRREVAPGVPITAVRGAGACRRGGIALEVIEQGCGNPEGALPLRLVFRTR